MKVFQREARAVAALNHPNICTLHDVGPNYLVMEHLEGGYDGSALRQGAAAVRQALWPEYSDCRCSQCGLIVSIPLSLAASPGAIGRVWKFLCVTKPILGAECGSPRDRHSVMVIKTEFFPR